MDPCPPLHPPPSASNLPAPLGPTPLPTRVAEVCNLQPQPVRRKRPGLQGLTSWLHAQVLDSPRFSGPDCSERWRRAGGLAARLGMGRPRRKGPWPLVQRSGAVRTRAAPAALGLLQQPLDARPTRPAPRSWALAPTPALQLAPDPARRREQGGGDLGSRRREGEAVGEELGARGVKEGRKGGGGCRGPAAAGASPASPEAQGRAQGGALCPHVP